MQKREQDGDTRPMIIVGGTGLYIKSLLKGLAPLPDIPSRVREHWSRVAESEGGLAALQNALRESSPSWFEALQDTHNRRRLQRALELVDCGMTSPPETWRHAPEDSSRPLTGLRMHRDALNQRIARRTHEMFEQGLVDEARALLKQFPRLSQTALKAIGYAEAFAFIRRELPLERAIEKTIVRTRRLAKRQRTWFEHQVNVDWVDVDSICADIAHDAILAKWRTEGPLPICQSTT